MKRIPIAYSFIALVGVIAALGAPVWAQDLPSRGVIESRDPEAYRTPMVEARALWVVRDSITSPERIENVIATARRCGINTLFVQVRGRADAFYNSTLEPRAEELERQPADFDPLATVIARAHEFGIQVHAWMNTDFIWSGKAKPRSPMHIVNQHPEWLARTSDGHCSPTATSQCEGLFVTPANPEVRKHNHDVFLEVVNNYAIDGIHFDYIRYPNASYDFSESTTRAFCTSMRLSDPAAPDQTASRAVRMHYIKSNYMAWTDWRRAQVTDMVESIARDAHAAKPGLVVSAAVFANWNDAFEFKGQDWKKWLADGAIDAIVPMAYSTNTATVASQIADAETAAAQAGRLCYAGIGAWHISVASAAAKVQAARAMGAQGIALFSYGGVTKDGESTTYIDKLARACFARPATLPAMPWNRSGTAVSDSGNAAKPGLASDGL